MNAPRAPQFDLPATPIATADQATALLGRQGFAVASPALALGLAGAPLAPLAAHWESLPADPHLKDGGRYRFRRHGCFTHDVAAGSLEAMPHRAHFQPTTYNALHGGFERWFEPLQPGLAGDAAFRGLVGGLGRLFSAAAGAPMRWFVEAHAFRIDTAEGVGRPTPEGAHRDGVDFVAVVFVGRRQVKGGETRVFEAEGPRGVRFLLSEPWSALLMDDARVIHETTPIVADGEGGRRDTLVLTYRRGGFQEPATPDPMRAG